MLTSKLIEESSLDIFEGGIRVQCRVPVDLPWIEGHFPGSPIVPGVVLAGWALEYLEKWPVANESPAMACPDCKFINPVLTGQALTIEWLDKGRSFEGRIYDGETVFARFRLAR